MNDLSIRNIDRRIVLFFGDFARSNLPLYYENYRIRLNEFLVIPLSERSAKATEAVEIPFAIIRASVRATQSDTRATHIAVRTTRIADGASEATNVAADGFLCLCEIGCTVWAFGIVHWLSVYSAFRT